jgi:hypothetical protein
MVRRGKFAGALALGLGAWAFGQWSKGKPGAGERHRVTYPPVDRLKRVAEDLWIVDSGPISPMGLTMPIRMTVIRFSSGELLLHSPTQHGDELARELEQLGPVRHLVASSIAHWTFITGWQDAFPGARVWAVPNLRNRAQVRQSGLRIDADLGDTTPAEWAQDVEQGLVRGGGFQEAWLLHRPSRTLVLTDLIENLEPAKLPPASAAMAQIAWATRGSTAAHVRAAVLMGGGAARESIRRMVGQEPERVIFAHGAWFADDGAGRLRRAFDWIL